MKDIRIIFMGTPEFAVFSLDAILSAGYNVVGVITAADKPSGRGRKLKPSPVKKYALDKGLKLFQPNNLKSEAFLEELEKLNADLQVVVAFRMLPEKVWKMPKLGTFNLHASLLPQYRGAAPINWAIINGEKTTGVSTFFIDEKIDTGNIIAQKKVEIKPKDTAGDLHNKLMLRGAKLILKTIKNIKDAKDKAVTQELNKSFKPAPKLDKENTRIDWSQSVETIFNLIRGLNPYPAAWSILENNEEHLKIKLFKVSKLKQEHHVPEGNITEHNNKLKVAAANGFIILDEIQLPGKRKMNVEDLLNGFDFAPDAKLL